MPKRVDTAYIEFLPDFSGFDAAVTRQVNTAMQHVEKTVDRTAADVSHSFDEVERDIEQTFNEIARSGDIDFNQLVRVAQRAALLVDESFSLGNESAETSFNELQHAASRNFDQIARDGEATAAKVKGSFSLLSIAGSTALLGVGTAAVAGLGALSAMGLKSAASLEQTKISFASLLGSAEEGEKTFRDLQQFAAVTPFTFPDVAAAAKRFLAFKDSVGLTKAGLEDYLTTIGNVISVTGGSGEAFSRISLAIGQIGSASKVTLDNLNQIADAIPGFSPIQAIAKQLGVTTAEAMQMVSSGSISASEGVQALLAGMKEFPGAAGAMEKQSQTLLGVFSTFQDTVGQALADAFAPAIPAIKDSLTKITPIIGDALKEIAPLLGNIIASFGPILSVLVQSLVPVLKPLLEGFETLFKVMSDSGAISALGEAFGEIFDALKPLWPVIGQVAVAFAKAFVPVLQQLAPIIADLAPVFVQLILALLPLIPSLGELAAAVIQLLEPFIKAAAVFLQWFTIEAIAPIIRLLAAAISLLAKPLAELAKGLQKIDWNKVGKAIEDFFKKVGGFFKGIGKFFEDLPGNIWKGIKEIPSLLGKMLDLALTAIGVGIGLVIAAFIAFPQLLIQGIINLPSMLGKFFSDMWTDLKKLWTDHIDDVISFFTNLPQNIVDGLVAGWHLISDFFADQWKKLGDNAGKAVSNIVDFFVHLPDKLSSFGSSVGSGILDWLKGRVNAVIKGINAGIDKVDDALPGVTLPRLPTLAQGALVTKPTLAVIGEAGPEVVVPINKPQRAAQLLDQAGMGQAQAGGLATPAMHFEVHVYVGDREITDIVDVRVNAKMQDVVNDIARGPKVA